jgi:hypothetical protein
MGGHAAGEVASALALEVLTRTVREHLLGFDVEGRLGVLKGAVEAANTHVWEDAQTNPSHRSAAAK